MLHASRAAKAVLTRLSAFGRASVVRFFRNLTNSSAAVAAHACRFVQSARSQQNPANWSQPMSESTLSYHISSAVIATLPARTDGVLAEIAKMENVEIHGHAGGKIVVVIEGTSTGVLGDCLSRISLLDGVIAANMVFEHVETEEAQSDDRRTDAA
jgi:periplasmic nitrate reductase NapD